MRIKKYAAVAMLAVPALILTGCSKPSEADLHNAIETALVDSGATEEQAAAYADCAAPKMHDELGSDTLEKILEDPMSDKMVDADDADAAAKIDSDCTDKVLDNG